MVVGCIQRQQALAVIQVFSSSGNNHVSLDSATASQACEYEKLRQDHRLGIAGRENAGLDRSDSSEDGNQAATTTLSSEGNKNSNAIEKYYLTTLNTTQWNTKAVICSFCNESLYTHPIAPHIYNELCDSIASLEENVELRYEEKIQDMEGEDVEMT